MHHRSILTFMVIVLAQVSGIKGQNYKSVSKNPSTNKDTILNNVQSTPEPKWFNEGNLDFISNGFIRSSTNIITINLGDPDKFHLPFYFLMGTTTDILNEVQELNETTVSDLLNKKGGFINFGIDAISPLYDLSDHSQLKLIYLLGAKTVTGFDLEKNTNESFLSTMVSLGFLLETTAWQYSTPNQHGKAWIKFYISGSKNDENKMQGFFGQDLNHYLFGSNLEGGIQLDGLMDISFGYYSYLNNQHISLFKKRFLKLSANMFLNR